jgi:hypothetical protein
MLKIVSRFVLEVLPYALTALIAAIVVPGFLSSQLNGSQLRAALNGAERAVGVYAADAREQSISKSISNLSPSLLHNQLTAK